MPKVQDFKRKKKKGFIFVKLLKIFLVSTMFQSKLLGKFKHLLNY